MWTISAIPKNCIREAAFIRKQVVPFVDEISMYLMKGWEHMWTYNLWPKWGIFEKNNSRHLFLFQILDDFDFWDLVRKFLNGRAIFVYQDSSASVVARCRWSRINIFPYKYNLLQLLHFSDAQKRVEICVC